MKVPAEECARCSARHQVTFKQGEQRLAIIDTPLKILSPAQLISNSRAWRDGRACDFAIAMAPVRADTIEVKIDNFTFTPQQITVKAGNDGDLDQSR